MKCCISNRLALAITHDTQLVSGLFEIRDSGGFPTFPLRLSFLFRLSDSLSFVFIRDHVVPASFLYRSLILSSFFSFVRYESILTARSVAPIPK